MPSIWLRASALRMDTSDNSQASSVSPEPDAPRARSPLLDQLRFITDALSSVVLLVDLEDRCREVNQTYQQWFVREPASVVGRPLGEVLGDDAQQTLRDPLRRARRGERAEAEMTFDRGGGQDLRRVKASCVPHLGADGSVDGIAVVMEDITATENLARTIRANELFTSILSHDLRNPLQSILTAAELLIRRAPDEKFANTASRIVTSGNRMNRMIAQLIDFSRIRAANAVTLDPASADMAKIWRQAVDQVSSHGSSQGTGQPIGIGSTRVRVERSGETSGEWDPDRLGQVAANLLSNALGHGTPEGAVTVEIDGNAPDAITVHVRNQGAISAELLPKLFEPFQGGDRRGSRGDGLGLGLFITRQIVIAHGGSISVTSTVNEGTTVTFQLPRQTPARSAGR
jgi:PAS domain S-box-containing protein